VNTIAAQRQSFDIAELMELLERAKALQAQAEELQRKTAILMDVVDAISEGISRVHAARAARHRPINKIVLTAAGFPVGALATLLSFSRPISADVLWVGESGPASSHSGS
jgi:predicted phosphoribosyltransferase